MRLPQSPGGRRAPPWVGTIVLAAAPGLALAADPHPWISAPSRVPPPETHFTNLEDGARIETPYLLKFGLSRFGLAPIVKPVPGTGHHHLLVNRELPMEFTKPLPFNDQYIHFGKGQMETVLNVPPGAYTLRLLLADDKHIPHFIYSRPLHLTVTARREGIDPKGLVKPGVEILAPAAGTVPALPFRVVFHASGLNVGHVDVTEPGVGHFRLVAERAGGGTERIDFAQGATETWLAPPAGDYRLRVELVRNAAPNDTMAVSSPLALKVLR